MTPVILSKVRRSRRIWTVLKHKPDLSTSFIGFISLKMTKI